MLRQVSTRTWLRLPHPATLGPLLALIAACAFFATQSDRFLTGDNLSLILQQVMVVGVLAIGQTLIILTAGVDLSCGTVMALGGIVMTKLVADSGIGVPAARHGVGFCLSPFRFHGLDWR